MPYCHAIQRAWLLSWYNTAYKYSSDGENPFGGDSVIQ